MLRFENHAKKRTQSHICRFEEMERRELLSANPFTPPAEIHLGIFTEDQNNAFVALYAPQNADQGNVFQVAWSGGADDTALAELTINLRENLFFDIYDGDGIGAGLAHSLTILGGDDLVQSYTISADFTSITFVFNSGVFTADKTLRFHIDVDENLSSPGGTPDAAVSGTEIGGDPNAVIQSEIGGTKFTAIFTSNDFQDLTFSETFFDEFAFAAPIAGKLLTDAGEIGVDNSLNTAGAQAHAQLVAKPSSLSGFVYEDWNNDGIKNNGESGIEGVTLRLQVWNAAAGKFENVVDADGKPREAITDANGAYSFTDLEAFHNYRIAEVQPSNYLNGEVTAGFVDGTQLGIANKDNNAIRGIKLGANQHGVDYNFGELNPGSLSGTVYEDDNDNGIHDASEAGIVGVEIALEYFDLASGTWILEQTTFTDQDGNYSFENLAPNKVYRLVEYQPANYVSGTNTAGTINGVTGGDVEDDDIISGMLVGYYQSGINYNFGELKYSSLAGTVFEDDNANGVQDNGEVGIDGVTLTLQFFDATSGNWLDVTNTVTDTGGAYIFENLNPRLTYRIVESQPENYYTTQNTAGNATIAGNADNANDWITDIKMSAGQSATGYNFGERYHRASLSGTVYEDKNQDGIIDAGENGIANVALTLQYRDTSGNWVLVQTTTTDANGNYTFSEIDPRFTYRVIETQPNGYKTTQNSAGDAGGDADDVNDWITEIIVAPQQDATNYNFGERLMLGSLTGTIYEDADNDGIVDPEEKLLENVKVELCVYNETTGQFEPTGIFTYTDENGNYTFDNLAPGTYCVTRAETPTGYCDGKETLGDHGGEVSTTSPRMYDISVVGDEASQGYNFALAQQGSISGFVFIDDNGNGVKDAGEKSLAGISVSLWVLQNGVYVATPKTAITDANGFYEFTELCAFKTYAVLETQPTAYDDGNDFVGTINGVQVGSSAINDFLAGIALGNGDAAINYNFTELEKPVPPTPPPVPPVPPPPTPTPIPPPAVYTQVPTLPYAPFVSLGAPSPPPMLALTTFATNSFGGGIAQGDLSWHISVLNGGYPRAAQNVASAQSMQAQALQVDDGVQKYASNYNETYDATARNVEYVSAAWDAASMEEMVWYVRDKSGRVVKKTSFGMHGAKPVVADFNGDGIDEVAVFQNGQWFIDINGNGTWDTEDIWCELGTAADQPVTGDWDGDGKIDIGVFGAQWAGDSEAIARDPGLPSDLNATIATRPKSMSAKSITSIKSTTSINGAFTTGGRTVKHSQRGNVRSDAIDHVFRYGGHGDVAITGDWSGDGITKIGVYRNGKWQLDYNGDGRFDANDVSVSGEHFSGAMPVTGDFNGDGKTNIGLFVDGLWLLDTTGDFAFDTEIQFGEIGDLPAVGDFSGNGIAELAVMRPRIADALFTKFNNSHNDSHDDAPIMSEAAPRIASQFRAENSMQNTADSQNDSFRQERTQHTPFTSVPLERE